MERRFSIVLFLGLSIFLSCTSAEAAETDNYSLQNFNQPDVTAQVDKYFNDAIDHVIAGWSHHNGTDQNKFIRKVYRKLKGNLVNDRFTSWAKKNLPTHEVKKKDSIYKEVGPTIAPIFAIFGVGKSINLQGIPVGLDKVSHFLGAGYIMWKRNYRRGKGLQDAIDWAQNSESSFLGQRITGVYSNGDLIADYEGMLFFRGLFDPEIYPGRGALVKFEGSKPVKLRNFDLLDHFSPFWSEAIMPSSFKKKVADIVARALPARCALYRQSPQFYEISDELRAQLDLRYEVLPILHEDSLLMQNVCN